MAKLTPVAMVIDRATTETAKKELRSLPGAWGQMYSVWEVSGVPYLVMLAHTSKRVRLGMPLTYACLTATALRDALRTACGQLSDVDCRWYLYVQQGSEAERIARSVVLLDAVPRGQA